MLRRALATLTVKTLRSPSTRHVFRRIRPFSSLVTQIKQNAEQKSIARLIDQHTPEQLQALSTQTDERGFNIFHTTAFHHDEPGSILQLLAAKLGKYAVKPAKMIANNGFLPIQVLMTRRGRLEAKSEAEGTEILDSLVFLDNDIPPTQTPIHLPTILDTYSEEIKADPSLENDFKMVTEAANAARAKIKVSISHPDLDRASFFTRAHVTLSTQLMWQRERFKKNKGGGLCREELQKYQFENKVNHIERFSQGECVEFSVYALSQLPKGEALFIEKGYHSIGVYNRNPKSSLQDFTTWGANKAIVFDAWGGNICLAKDIPFKLKYFLWPYESFRKEKLKTCIIGPLNFNFHYFRLLFAKNIPSEPTQQFHTRSPHSILP